jgi:hypothetical protein
MNVTSENYVAGNRSVFYAWNIHWFLGEPYSCPETLIDALNNKGPFKDRVHYLVAPNTGKGLATIPEEDWTCNGQKGGVAE